tara:strand:- start:1195 stop:1425 length:231 start_codon:yes stop_codon:yes gene_type:complete
MTQKSHLRAYREALGLSQAALAKEIGVQDAAICKWEKGRVSVQMVLTVERITGIPRHLLRPDVYPAPVRRSEGAAA